MGFEIDTTIHKLTDGTLNPDTGRLVFVLSNLQNQRREDEKSALSQQYTFFFISAHFFNSALKKQSGQKLHQPLTALIKKLFKIQIVLFAA